MLPEHGGHLYIAIYMAHDWQAMAHDWLLYWHAVTAAPAAVLQCCHASRLTGAASSHKVFSILCTKTASVCMLVAVNFGERDGRGGVNAVEAFEEPPLESSVEDDRNRRHKDCKRAPLHTTPLSAHVNSIT